ncbi:hypothetical protein G7072_18030 [Nocardioides sp. HDW12B]|uniref:DUF6351 family protein n=1 Tax=Nocardioides sp. HDW12B TaxID=2714939 RepID=UPI00140984F1|nr:DUF6351 family protein [Nocardioides sp. HDW12B]QIK67986.1 hypothetical protein G7072_18030 [Nocardioides sp. HDW12B]
MPVSRPARRRAPLTTGPGAALAATVLAGLLAAPLVAAGPAASAPTSASATGPSAASVAVSRARAAVKPLAIRVESNRADLVSGGDALTTVVLPPRVAPRDVRVRLNGDDVTRQFRVRPNGRFQALVRGLDVGRNVLVARAPGREGRRTVVNHPDGGPIFSGPQLQPYTCQAGALDAQCRQPATYSFLYKSTDPRKPGLQPYDRDNPPQDVASTTTDEGVRVPFIVRREDGFQDRDRYTILTLFRPGRDWKPWKAQDQWNEKVVVPHGGNCGAAYAPGDPRLDDYSGTIPETPGYEQSYVAALGQGFAVLSTALNNTGHNCNLPIEAESMMMAKERLVEQYGPIRYTIGTGCSGGSIAQHTIANAYPGIYQGLVTSCSYPDTLTAGAQFADYHLLRRYFEDPSRWGGGAVWTEPQMAEVEGHLSHMNAIAADEGLFKEAINPESACPGTRDTVAGDESTRFDSETNPGGVRCSILDMMATTLGVRPESDWSATEQAAGRGFTGVPFANTGVQYGLGALQKGLITPAQFVDLNVKVGGLDINADPVPERLAGDRTAIENVYRSGLVNEANHLDEVAIINHGGPDPGIAHDYSHAFWTEERLLADQGDTGNRVMWFGPTPLIGDLDWAKDALFAMDRWLSAVEADRRSVPLAAKVADDRPADVTDRCQVEGFETVGTPAEPVCRMPALQTRLGTPRQVAGGPVANDTVACVTQPLDRSDYVYDAGDLPVPFTDEQWAALEELFADGVCDWSRPGVGQGPAETWLRYGTAGGAPIYGGENLPAPPAASGTGWSAPSFRELLRQ